MSRDVVVFLIGLAVVVAMFSGFVLMFGGAL